MSRVGIACCCYSSLKKPKKGGSWKHNGEKITDGFRGRNQVTRSACWQLVMLEVEARGWRRAHVLSHTGVWKTVLTRDLAPGGADV